MQFTLKLGNNVRNVLKAHGLTIPKIIEEKITFYEKLHNSLDPTASKCTSRQPTNLCLYQSFTLKRLTKTENV